MTTNTNRRSRGIALAVTTILAAGLLGSILPATAADPVHSLRGQTEIDSLNDAPGVFRVHEGGMQQRAYRQQPPLIPHRVEKYEIDIKVNQCLRCHDWPYNTEFNAPKVSETHYQDRNGNRLDKVAGSRWFCTQCHVPQADAPPLVDNTFQSIVEQR